MSPYNQLLTIVLNSFGIDLDNISSNAAVDSFLEKSADEECLDDAVSKSIAIISGLKVSKPENYEEIVMCMVRDYISKSLYTDSALLKLLHLYSKKDILDSFISNHSFAEDLVVHFILNLYEKDVKIIANYDNFGLLQKYSSNLVIDFLNDVVRNALIRIYNYFQNPKETYEFLEKALYNQVLTNDEHFRKALVVVLCYKNFVMRIIYADVYEFLSTLSDSKAVNNLKAYIERCVSKGKFSLDPSFSLENEAIFSYYFYLNNDKRYENHQNVNDEQKKYLREINPLYMFESSGIIKK